MDEIDKEQSQVTIIIHLYENVSYKISAERFCYVSVYSIAFFGGGGGAFWFDAVADPAG